MIPPDEELIRPTAARYANRYRMVERDDIAQELRLWWITHQRVVNRYLEEEKTAFLARALNRAAERYCRDVRAQSVGYSPADEFFYNAGQLRELLPLIWKPELVIQDQQPDEGGKIRSGKPANEGNNLLAMVSDVARGFVQLEWDQRNLLEIQFGLGFTNKDMAGFFDTTEPAIKMRVQRALDALVQILGGKSPYDDFDGPGSRHAMSNAHAQAITSNQEIGE